MGGGDQELRVGWAFAPLAALHVGPFACFLGYRNTESTMSQIAGVQNACQSQGRLIKRKTVSGPRFLSTTVWEQEKAAFLCGVTRLCLCHFPSLLSAVSVGKRNRRERAQAAFHLPWRLRLLLALQKVTTLPGSRWLPPFHL